MMEEVIVHFVDSGFWGHLIQSGLGFITKKGVQVITPYKKIWDVKPTVYVEIKMKNKFICLRPSYSLKFQPLSLQIILQRLFERTTFELFRPFENYLDSSYFLFLCCDFQNNPSLSKIDMYLPSSVLKFRKGEDIFVSYSPGGNKEFFGTLCSGTVDETFGNSNEVVMIEASLAVGSEGAPIHVINDKDKVLAGVVISRIFSRNHEKYVYSGFSIGVSLSLLFSGLTGYSPPIINNSSVLYSMYPWSRRAAAATFAVVWIARGCGIGSGIVVGDNIVMTCSHVVSYRKGIQVLVGCNNSVQNGTVIFATKSTSKLDLALIKVEKVFDNIYGFSTFSDSPPIQGEKIYSLGVLRYDQSHYKFISKGIVSFYEHPDLLHTQGTIFPGCSGGAVIRGNGDTIGILIGVITYHDSPAMNKVLPLFPIVSSLRMFLKSRDVKVLYEMVDNYNHLMNVKQRVHRRKIMDS